MPDPRDTKEFERRLREQAASSGPTSETAPRSPDAVDAGIDRAKSYGLATPGPVITVVRPPNRIEQDYIDARTAVGARPMSSYPGDAAMKAMGASPSVVAFDDKVKRASQSVDQALLARGIQPPTHIGVPRTGLATALEDEARAKRRLALANQTHTISLEDYETVLHQKKKQDFQDAMAQFAARLRAAVPGSK